MNYNFPEWDNISSAMESAKVGPKVLTSFAVQFFAQATVWDALAFKHQQKEMAKINFDQVRFWPFSQSPRAAAGAARINCGDALRSATELMIDLKSCNSHSLHAYIHAACLRRPENLFPATLSSILCSWIQLRFHPLWRTRISCRCFMHSCGCLFCERSPRAEVRAAIKLTNFSMLVRARPRVF